MTATLLPLLPPVLGFGALLALGYLVPALNDVLNLALPFFGLIGLGYFCGKLKGFAEAGLQWMNFFIVYVALPGLFFNLISKTPVAELANGRFIIGTTLATMTAFAVSFGVGMISSRGRITEATIQGVAGSYSNIGYMGPGLTLAALGVQSVAPTALIFVADNIFLFTITPFLMALGGARGGTLAQTAWLVVVRIVTHPFNVASVLAVLAALFQVQPPVAIGRILTALQNAAAPCALFTMGVTVALRPMKRIAADMPVLLAIKLLLHPVIVLVLLSALGPFDPIWVFTAVLMASLPPALNVFVMASQYQVWVERASSLILVGTIASVVTVTGLLWLIAAGHMPHRLF